MILKENTEIEQVENGYVVSVKREGKTQKHVFSDLQGLFTFVLGHYTTKKDIEIVVRETRESKQQRKKDREAAEKQFGFPIDKAAIQDTLAEMSNIPAKTGCN